jgi:hypothetical protein
MLEPQKTLEREALLKRIREIRAEIAQSERNMQKLETQLPIEEQLSLRRRRFIEATFLSWRAMFGWWYIDKICA